MRGRFRSFFDLIIMDISLCDFDDFHCDNFGQSCLTGFFFSFAFLFRQFVQFLGDIFRLFLLLLLFFGWFYERVGYFL